MSLQKNKSHKEASPPPLSRQRYEDPSQQFINWVNRFGIEKTFFGRFLLYIEEHLKLRLVVAVFLYSCLLAFCIYFEGPTHQDYQLGNPARVAFKSPFTFEMVDEVTTEQRRTAAENKVLPIFDYDPEVFERVTSQILRSFREIRPIFFANVKSNEKNKNLNLYKEFYSFKNQFAENLGTPLPDYLFDWLAQNSFSVNIENQLIEIIEILYREKITEGLFSYLGRDQNQLLVKTLGKKNKAHHESTYFVSEVKDLSNLDLFRVNEVKDLISGYSKIHQQHLVALAKLVLKPNLSINLSQTTQQKTDARNSILPLLITVKKDQIIIPQGALVAPNHLSMLAKINQLRSDKRSSVMVFSLALFFTLLIFLFQAYLKRYTLNKVKPEQKDLTVMGLIILSQVLLTKGFLFITESSFLTNLGSTLPTDFFLYLAPLAAGSMLVGLLLTSGEIVFMFNLFSALAFGFLFDFNYSLALYVLVGGIGAARSVYGCKTRNDLYFAGIKTGLINALTVALIFSSAHFDNPEWLKQLLVLIPAGFVSGLLSSMMALSFVPVLESLFNYTTDVRLLELSNLNHPLLKQMIVKAPGTYHHSMMVGSMVEAAAEEIGANPLLGKVMSYYHDIGKMEHAAYFIENQKPGHNPHDHISPYMSRTLLVAHVKDGVELGLKHKLGKPIIDGILQHHGTTLISFFHNKAVDLCPEGDLLPEESEFRYPGPKPQFREAALCMLADSIEAAARSLDEPTPQRLQNIVKNIIQKKFMDGQLDECNLTLKDLHKVEKSFIRILLGIYHQRIDYPRSAGGGLGDIVNE